MCNLHASIFVVNVIIKLAGAKGCMSLQACIADGIDIVNEIHSQTYSAGANGMVSYNLGTTSAFATPGTKANNTTSSSHWKDLQQSENPRWSAEKCS